MNKIFIIACCLVTGILFTACKTVESLAGKKLRKRSANYILEKLAEQKVDFDWVNAKAKAKVESPDRNVSFIIKLRMRKDSLIWLQIKKLSVEGLRVQMSPNNIEILNRQENQYIVDPFSSIEQQLAIPLDFAAVENLLIGNPILYDQMDFKATIDSNRYLMSGQIPDKNVAGSTLGKLRFWLNADFQIVELEATMGDRKIRAEFSKYEAIDNHRTVAMKKHLYIESPESGKVQMKIDFNKLEFDKEVGMRFIIPDHYKKIVNGVRR